MKIFNTHITKHFSILILNLIVLYSCTIKIQEINHKKFNHYNSYLIAGEKNEVKFNSLIWKIDSLSIGAITKIDKRFYVDVKDVELPVKGKIFAKSKIIGIKKQVEIIASRKPNVSLNFYPFDVKDTIYFDNIRFLRFRLESDSSSFEKVKIDSDFFECRFDSIVFYNTRNRIYKENLDRIFELKPKHLFIDTVHYTYQKTTYKQAVNKTFHIIYPEKNNYTDLIDETITFHENSLKAITGSGFGKMQNKIGKVWTETFEIAEYNKRKVKYVYADRYYMNMGELEGVNLIKVKSSTGELLFERLIDGRNQRIEDFLDFYGHDELHIEIRGFLEWDILIRFI
jgi:hypothetical protein